MVFRKFLFRVFREKADKNPFTAGVPPKGSPAYRVEEKGRGRVSKTEKEGNYPYLAALTALTFSPSGSPLLVVLSRLGLPIALSTLVLPKAPVTGLLCSRHHLHIMSSVPLSVLPVISPDLQKFAVVSPSTLMVNRQGGAAPAGSRDLSPLSLVSVRPSRN